MLVCCVGMAVIHKYCQGKSILGVGWNQAAIWILGEMAMTCVSNAFCTGLGNSVKGSEWHIGPGTYVKLQADA